MSDAFRYVAFLSYSSKDGAFARRLHAALERFRIPGTLGRFNLAGKVNRIYPVFRDREELPAGILGEEIKTALRASSALIVVCSHHAAESRWVDTEVRYFSSLGRPNRIFAIIPDTQSDASTADIASDLFPVALREAVNEVLAADARKSRDGFRNALLKIVAGLISVNAGALRDRSRQRRLRIASLAAASAVSLLTIIVAWIVLSDRINARDAFTARAMLLAERGEEAAALPYALAGLGGASSAAEGVVDSLGARLPAIAFVDVPSSTHYTELSPDGTVVADRTGDYEFALWDANTGARRGPARRAADFWFVDDSKRIVLFRDDYRVEFIDTQTGLPLAPAQPFWPARDGDSVFIGGRTVAARTGEDEVTVWDARSGQRLAQLHSPNVTWPLHVSPSGQRLLTCDEEAQCVVWDLSKQQAIARIDGVRSRFAFSSNDERFASGSGSGKATLWDGTSGAVIQQVRLGPLGTDVYTPQFLSDGTRVAIHSQGYSSGRGQLLDARSGALVLDLGSVSGSDAVRFSVDGRRMAVAKPEMTASILDPESGRTVVSFDTPDSVSEIELSPDASRLIIQSFDLKTSLWNGISGQKIRDLAVDDKISSVQFSIPGGPFLIATLETPPTLWSNDGVKLAQLGPTVSYSVQMSRDGKRIAGMAGEEVIGIWDSSQQPIPGRGEELRRRICAATGVHAIPRFRKQDREARDTVASYLKGRPWGVCDWHPLSNGMGWLQTTRYWGVKIGLLPDYPDGE